MKFIKRVFAATLLLACVVSLPLAPVACRNVDPSGVYQGDKALYNADKTIVDSYDVLHAFVKFEFENRTSLTNTPAIGKAANDIRRNAQKWTDSALALRDAYVASPTPANRSALEDAVRVLRQAVTQAQNYMKK